MSSLWHGWCLASCSEKRRMKMTSWKQQNNSKTTAAQQLSLPLHEFKLRQTSKQKCQHRLKRGRKPKTPNSFLFSLMLIVTALPRLQLKVALSWLQMRFPVFSAASLEAKWHVQHPERRSWCAPSSVCSSSVFAITATPSGRRGNCWTRGRFGNNTGPVPPPRGQMCKQWLSGEECLNSRHLDGVI